MKIDASTRLYCIFGKPVTHSLSPAMHNAAFEHMGINAVYMAFEPDNIADAVHAMRHLHISGASVTIPYKVDVMASCQHVDSLARKIGSVNTLFNDGGNIHAFNTDGAGITETLKEAGVDVQGGLALVLGNGGSARAAAFTLAEHGAELLIAGRNSQRVRALADDIVTTGAGVETSLITDLDTSTMRQVDIIINTTPVGMHPNIENSPLPPDLIMKHHVVFDIVYSPRITRLLNMAKQKGCVILTGDNMLLHQACRQFTIWTGKEAPVDIMRQALEAGIQK
ncbi:MAG: shikimate dehydrogenase [Spirochaetota bacterium]